MHESLQKLVFPVVAFSRVGWEKAAENIGELTESADERELPDFLDMRICDSAGRLFVVEEVWRAWPKSKMGARLCRVFNNCIFTDFKLSEPFPISLEELKQRLPVHEQRRATYEARTYRELIEMLL